MTSSFLACVTCVNTMTQGGGDAIGKSILFLLITIVCLLAIVAFFMVRMMMRSNKNLDSSLQDDFQH